MRVPNSTRYWIKIVLPWIQNFYPVLGLESGGRLLRHFQTPVLYWINFGLRNWAPVFEAQRSLQWHT